MTYTDWSGFLDANSCATEDLYIVLYGPTNELYGDGYVPKGANINIGSLDVIKFHTNTPMGVRNGCLEYQNILTSSPTVQVYTYGITAQNTGNNSDERMIINSGSASYTIPKRTTISYNDEGIRLLVRS